MRLRSLLRSDLPRLKEIHDAHFSEDFIFPNFNRFLGTVCILDDNDDIVVAGGILPIVESILITNKDQSVRNRREGLLKALKISVDFCKIAQENQLHAFVKDENFSAHLKKYGFNPIKGEGLVLRF